MTDQAQSRSPKVGVAIVNFNGGLLLTRAVSKVLSSAVPVEVFVVDNGSRDGSIEQLQQAFGADGRLTVIRNEGNLGFTRASNMALRRARGEFLLLLNPDCVIERDSLARMLEVLAQHPQAGMAGCLIRNPDGSEQAGCRRAVPTPWRTLVRIFHLDKLFPAHPRFRSFVLNREPLPAAPAPVEAISGAFMLVRREAVAQVGLMDEAYFLHCDDLDWCMRFRQAGWQILFVPNVAVTHYQGTCSAGRPLFVLWHKHRGMMRFYRKFFRRQYPAPVMALVAFGVWLRFGLLACATVPRIVVPRLGARSGRARQELQTAQLLRIEGPHGATREVGRARDDEGDSLAARQHVRLRS